MADSAVDCILTYVYCRRQAVGLVLPLGLKPFERGGTTGPAVEYTLLFALRCWRAVGLILLLGLPVVRRRSVHILVLTYLLAYRHAQDYILVYVC